MGHTVYSRALVRAAEILGGIEALQRYLMVSTRQLELWIKGYDRLPDHVFLKVADLLAERDIRDLHEGARPGRSEGGPP